MEVRNCKGCGKIFNYIGGMPMCEACKKALEDKFQEVKAYIYDNRDADINQVAEENDVSVQQIRQWVREERLEFSENSRVGLSCEKCGRMIRSGRYCKSCKDKLANELGGMYKAPKETTVKKDTKSNAKMRFLDK
ncbi:MAG: flagellar protein [Lachnospiraceae bacterium]|nr:flagellar protein [Lachnospiraceae bacterium]